MPSEDEKLLKFDIKIGNLQHHMAPAQFIPPEQIDDTNLTLKCRFSPIQIIYQAQAVKKLFDFLNVKLVHDATKAKAADLYNEKIQNVS